MATEANIYSYLDVDSSHTRATLVTNKYIQLPRAETSRVFVKICGSFINGFKDPFERTHLFNGSLVPRKLDFEVSILVINEDHGITN